MDQIIVFRELLGEIREKARAQGNIISRKEVEAFFAHAGLTQQELDLICRYLTDSHVRVEAFDEGDIPGEDPGRTVSSEDVSAEDSVEEESSEVYKDAGLIEQYLQELEQIGPVEAAAELELFHRVCRGDIPAREELAKAYLKTVASLVAEYEGEEIAAEDLLQEGNVGLLLALDQLEPMDSLAAYRTNLFNGINRYLEEVIEAHRTEADAGAAALRKVNRLDEAMQSLMEDLGRKVTVEELSAFLDLPAEEIRDIARLAGSDLEFADGPADLKMPWEL